jgi:hypothetical protein
MENYQKAIHSILHEGLTTYKKRGSSAALPLQVKALKQEKGNKKGALFVTRSKRDLSTDQGVKGYVVTSKESLIENAPDLTHWTPNVFNYGTYTNSQRKFIKGHEELNLQQINTFVVDIDSKQNSYPEILTASMDDSIGAPTLILETDKGYQVYFVLNHPLFISNRNQFRGLKVAKRISENIKRSMAKNLKGVDITCNDFGFFRLPKRENVRWFSQEMVYDFGDLIAWSQREDDNVDRTLFSLQQVKTSNDPTLERWFKDLLSIPHIKGGKGVIGRDNLFYTVALACYSAGKSEDEAFDLLDEYNTDLKSPLKNSEVIKVIRSAYKGRFKGANKSYIKRLLEEWGNGEDYSITNVGQGWHKFKKNREDRERSHYDEWEKDILDYIGNQTASGGPFIWSTQKNICESIGMARSTFHEVIKRSHTIIIQRKGKGCNAKTGLSSVTALWQYALKVKQQKANEYNAWTTSIIQQIEQNEASRILENMMKQRVNSVIERARSSGFI